MDPARALIQKEFPRLDAELEEYLVSMLNSEDFEWDDFIASGSSLVSGALNWEQERAEQSCSRLLEQLGKEHKSAKADSAPRSLVKNNALLEADESKKLSEVSKPTAVSKSREARDKKKKRKEAKKNRGEASAPEKNQPQTQSFLASRETGSIEENVDSTNTRYKVDEQFRLNSKHVMMRGVCISFGDVDILVNSPLKFEHGHKYGLVGRNGVGKTTLLRHMAEGKIHQFPPRVRTLLVEQEATSDDRSILEVVMTSDQHQAQLQKRLADLELNPAENAAEISDIYQELEIMESDSAEARASSILKGLGFTAEMQQRPTSALSGGQRMRVSLACALFAKPDLLLLDEPTNHLDLNAALWLQEWIKKFENTVVIVSHDRYFLNAVITDIVYFNNKRLEYQQGDYDSFAHRRQERMNQQKHDLMEEEKKKKKIKESIENYKQNMRSKDSHAAMPMVKAKKSELERIELQQMFRVKKVPWRTFWNVGWKDGFGEFLTRAEEEEKEYRFRFPEPVGNLNIAMSQKNNTVPILQLSGVTFGYVADKPLFTNINLEVNLNSRICLVGPNGVGKSSLLGCLLGTITPTRGEVYRHRNLKIGYFNQHVIEQLDPTLTPMEHMQKLHPQENDQILRGHLGAFALGGKLAVQKMSTLSGGQKTRVALATLTWDRPHILVLDEPSNHLDYGSIDALIAALNEFAGGVIVVSHDQHLLSGLLEVDEDEEDGKDRRMYVISKGKIVRYEGTFDDYVDSITPKL
eukprot:TRINITY_DN7032_c0_g1_i1.p1 TRINITY_DN7032_c0_g1~~TRINITY_DN7032_c0_g1_i1.p1  ORF type:complete len:750 (+),score=233.62 TRINITY_DN7032_c0_g1_i1:194-2443(+)